MSAFDQVINLIVEIIISEEPTKVIELRWFMFLSTTTGYISSKCEQICRSKGINDINNDFQDWFKLCVVISDDYHLSMLERFRWNDYDLGKIVMSNWENIGINPNSICNMLIRSLHEDESIDAFKVLFVPETFKHSSYHGTVCLDEFIFNISTNDEEYFEYSISLEYVRKNVNWDTLKQCLKHYSNEHSSSKLKFYTKRIEDASIKA